MRVANVDVSSHAGEQGWMRHITRKGGPWGSPWVRAVKEGCKHGDVTSCRQAGIAVIRHAGATVRAGWMPCWLCTSKAQSSPRSSSWSTCSQHVKVHPLVQAFSGAGFLNGNPNLPTTHLGMGLPDLTPPSPASSFQSTPMRCGMLHVQASRRELRAACGEVKAAYELVRAACQVVKTACGQQGLHARDGEIRAACGDVRATGRHAVAAMKSCTWKIGAFLSALLTTERRAAGTLAVVSEVGAGCQHATRPGYGREFGRMAHGNQQGTHLSRDAVHAEEDSSSKRRVCRVQPPDAGPATPGSAFKTAAAAAAAAASAAAAVAAAACSSAAAVLKVFFVLGSHQQCGGAPKLLGTEHNESGRLIWAAGRPAERQSLKDKLTLLNLPSHAGVKALCGCPGGAAGRACCPP
eukprot:300571-Chlamydomonas_euryale.AAC.13